jgi:BASS family bile acid:Na+ symporter
MLTLDEPLGVGPCCLVRQPARFLPKLTELAKGNLPFAVGIMVLLAVGTVAYLPLVLPLLLPGATVNSGKIAGWLFLLALLPLAAGLALRAQYEGVAARVKPMLDWISNVILVPMVLLLAVANIDKILHVFGTRGILAGLLLIALGFGIGWMLGGSGIDTRTDIGPWYRAAQHRRRTRRCDGKLRQSERGHLGKSLLR